MTAKITATTTATWSFGPTTMTVNGRTFGASYSVARGGDVYVFTGVQAAPGAQRRCTPCRQRRGKGIAPEKPGCELGDAPRAGSAEAKTRSRSIRQ